MPDTLDPDFGSDDLVILAKDMRSSWHAMTHPAHLPGDPEASHSQQRWVLEALARGPRRMSDLAEGTCTSQASLTGIIDRMEERGLVERVRPAGDRRVVEVSLTEAGRQEKARVHGITVARLGKMLEPLDAAERLELMRLFRKMATSAAAGSNR
ncbi:MAG: MarR family transcriptional regulator [Coriobacteriia bacterium]|nr:MarR family transcriptional regulator [Coriobacteriia bacterium]